MNLADYVSPSDAAQMLGISKRQMLRLVEQDELTAVMTPLGRLIDRASVETLAEERREKARS